MRITMLQDKKVLVLGLGDTGVSALRWLTQQGAKVTVADSRAKPPNVEQIAKEMPRVMVHKGAFKNSLINKQELIVISPGVSMQEPIVQQAIANGIAVIGDIELFAQFRPAESKVIGITGSNGKTTVTTLVGEMCKAAGLSTVVAGNIGLPVLDALALEKPDVYVLELSSFQLETTHSLQLDVAALLNISEDHLDRHADMQGYIDAKARIFAHAKTRVLNRDDAICMQYLDDNSITFGLKNTDKSVDYGLLISEDQMWLVSGQRKLMATHGMKIQGLHNAANALAALSICNAIGLEKTPILNALSQFKGLPHRVEWVAKFDEIDFYDDSKGTNVGATCAALQGLPQKVVLLAGGDGKDQDFSPLASAVQANARAVVLYGRDAPKIEAAILAAEMPIYRAADMREAVAIAHQVAKAGDAVLLSPACASFDMFKNYEHRAQVFIEAVRQLEHTRLEQMRLESARKEAAC